MTETIGKVSLKLDFYPGEDLYSDGDIEDELLRIVQENPAEEFPRIIAEKGSWPILYHLSPIRSNCIRWIDFPPDARVLEIGAGCGAITGTLAEKSACVTCVELSKRRSRINAERNREKENIEIFVGNFEDIHPALPQYDVVTLIGVLEYADSYIHSNAPYCDFLKIIKKHLKPNGSLITAIENKIGMKYWAGCREDHTSVFFDSIENYENSKRIRTFSKKELEQLMRSSGYTDILFYYPYPDYKLPMAIYSDTYLPTKGDLTNNLRNYDADRLKLFDEAKAFDSILDAGLFPDFSNSFLTIAHGGGENE